MTNLGFRLAMEAAGVRVVETAVGDRYVLEALAAGGYSIGGEQSGHVIFPALATTGDGLLTGGPAPRHRAPQRPHPRRPLGDGDDPLPQVLVNVKVARRDPDIAATLADEIAAAEARLGSVGRVLMPSERHRAADPGDGRGVDLPRPPTTAARGPRQGRRSRLRHGVTPVHPGRRGGQAGARSRATLR